MGVVVRYITDPACIHSWTVEPVVRRLMTEFGANLSWTFVMGGLARDIPEPAAVAREWLDVSARTGAVCDPGLWLEAPIASTYPAAMAVIAAAEQATDGGYAYLRALREGLVCFRRKLDTTEALVEAAREAGLDAARFRIDLNSNAIVEIFGAHLEEARSVPVPAGAERALPAMRFGDGEWIVGVQPYEAYAAAARAAGAEPAGEPAPDAAALVRRFGRVTAAEVELACNLPGPRAQQELWNLVAGWQARPVRVLGGHLFEAV